MPIGGNYMQIGDNDFPEDLYYHSEHCWARVEGDEVVIGFNDFAQKIAGGIKRVVTLEEDDEVSQDKPFGTISSGKWTGKIYAPVSGEITEVNEDVEDEPGLVNDDPYGEGWFIKVSPSNLDTDLANLKKMGPGFEDWMKASIAEKEALIK